MVYVFGTIALLCAVLAFKADDRIGRWFFIACCLFNLLGAAVAIWENDPYAFRLRPYSVEDAIDAEINRR